MRRRLYRALPWALVAVVALPSALAFNILGKRWPTTSITFYTGMPGTSPAGITWSSAFQQAMQQWTDKTEVEFFAAPQYVDPCAGYSRSSTGVNFPAGTGNLQNSIDFRSTLCGNDFGSSVLAITLSNATAGNFGFDQMVETDIVFNDRQNWDIYEGTRKFGLTDFRRAALHELGHAIGLGHQSVGVAIMAARITDVDQLQADDIAGANAIYAPRDACPLIDLIPNQLQRNKLGLPDCKVNQLFGTGNDTSFVDVYRLKLTATTRLVFDMRSSELDSVLVLTDAKYAQLDIADDYQGTCNARMDRILGAGEYRLLANTYANPRKCVGNSGNYTLSISDGKLPTLGDPAVTSGAAAAVLVTGGASADGGLSYRTTFSPTDSIAVDAGIAVDPEHVGLDGKLFVLVQLGDGSRFVKTASGDFVPFSGALTQLVPTRSGTLAAQETLSIVKDLRGQGTALAGQSFAVYVGYAIDSQPQSIHYGSEPIRFSILR